MKANLFKIATIVLVVGGRFSSCKKSVTELTQILIQNRTDSLVHVRLFLNEKYIDPHGRFMISDANGGSKDTEYAISPQ
jgi:hypothetical protein